MPYLKRSWKGVTVRNSSGSIYGWLPGEDVSHLSLAERHRRAGLEGAP